MVYAIIQARMGSSRLPGKIFMNFCGKPDIYHVYTRLRQSKKVEKIIVATTNDEKDDKVEIFCKENGISYFRGSESDVLDRFYKCSKYFGIKKTDIIVRITADCPLLDFELVDKLLVFFEKKDFDYVSNVEIPTYPDGLDIEVFKFESLEKAWIEAKKSSEREHVTPYIRENKNVFRIGSYENKNDLSGYRWTLDEIEDYELINKIYEHLYRENEFFLTSDILKLLEENPDFKKINDKYIRNEGYVKSLKNDIQNEKSDLK